MEPGNLTMEERRPSSTVMGHVSRDELENLDRLPPHRRTFMVRVLKLLLENGHLGHELLRMASGAQRPGSVRARLAGNQGADLGGARGPSASGRKAS